MRFQKARSMRHEERSAGVRRSKRGGARVALEQRCCVRRAEVQQGVQQRMAERDQHRASFSPGDLLPERPGVVDGQGDRVRGGNVEPAIRMAKKAIGEQVHSAVSAGVLQERAHSVSAAVSRRPCGAVKNLRLRRGPNHAISHSPHNKRKQTIEPPRTHVLTRPRTEYGIAWLRHIDLAASHTRAPTLRTARKRWVM